MLGGSFLFEDSQDVEHGLAGPLLITRMQELLLAIKDRFPLNSSFLFPVETWRSMHIDQSSILKVGWS